MKLQLAKLKSGYQANLNGLLLKEKTLQEDLAKTQEAIHQFRGALQALEQAAQLKEEPPAPAEPEGAPEANPEPPNTLQ